jgi:hypothetical protein
MWHAEVEGLVPLAQVFCDRHFGGINYPLGGVGRIAEARPAVAGWRLPDALA